MKAMGLIVAIAICCSVSLAQAREKSLIKKTAAVRPAQATTANSTPGATAAPNNGAGNSNGRWCRTADGRTAWVPSQPGNTQTLTSRRSFSLQSIYFSDDGQPLKIGGIDWYLNGRGPFSD